MKQEHLDSTTWRLMAKKLSGESTNEELAELDLFLRENPSENYFMELMDGLWNSETETDQHYAESKYKELVLMLQKLKLDEGKFDDEDHHIVNFSEENWVEKSSNNRKWFFMVAVAASVVLLVFLGISFFNNFVPKKNIASLLEKNEISTKIGSKTNLVLPDGTKVWMNADSKMTYDKNYGNKLREVTLVGEAYFDVVKNPEKPFIIHTSKMDIKVLGTAFNVKCYPEEKTTETSLIRGSIEVTMKDRSEKIILKPNEKLTINNNNDSIENNSSIAKKGKLVPIICQPIIEISHLTYEPALKTIAETSWLDNRLVFNNETFSEVAVKMTRWYGVKIIFLDKTLENYHFTGAFENENIEQAFAALKLISQFNYKIEKNIITISR